MSDGKKFENEIAQSCKALGAWTYSGNDRYPLCDRVACYKGLFLLLEAKDCSTDIFALKRVSQRERAQLRSVAKNGGHSVLLFKWATNRPRMFAITWEDFEELEQGLGFVPPWDLPKGQRNPRGSASISLDDRFRPPTFYEAKKVQLKDFQGGSLGTFWDLKDLFLRMGVDNARVLTI